MDRAVFNKTNYCDLTFNLEATKSELGRSELCEAGLGFLYTLDVRGQNRASIHFSTIIKKLYGRSLKTTLYIAKYSKR